MMSSFNYFSSVVPENVDIDVVVSHVCASHLYCRPHVLHQMRYKHFGFRPPSWIFKVMFDVAVSRKHFPWLHRPETVLASVSGLFCIYAQTSVK